MRKITFGVASSLDNYIARSDGGVDWLLWTKEVSSITSKFWKTIDTVLWGRKTYEVAARAGAPSFGNVKNYVFSRNRKTKAAKGFELISRDAVGFVRRLKAGPGKGICLMGGGKFGKSLFESDLIDEVVLNIHPVLLGSGIPLFHRMPQIDLRLIECRPLKNGCVLASYRVEHR
jgi:dihydrofolate reductase